MAPFRHDMTGLTWDIGLSATKEMAVAVPFRHDMTILTWDTGAERHKGDGGDGVLQADGAAEAASQVTNDGGQHTDHNNGHHEASPPTPVI